MSDLLNNLTEIPPSLLPLATLVLGLLGSIHCVGMCGPLVLAFTKTKKQNYLYQLGRLSGYLFVALSLYFLGVGVRFKLQSEWIVDTTAILLSLFMIIFGLGVFFKGKFDLTGMRPLAKLSEKIYFFGQKYGGKSQFSLGALSIFLPCGLLYGLLAIILISNGPLTVIAAISTFWLGTLPGLVLAPHWFKKLLAPLKSKAPMISSATFIFLGILTLFIRYQQSLNPVCH